MNWSRSRVGAALVVCVVVGLVVGTLGSLGLDAVGFQGDATVLVGAVSGVLSAVIVAGWLGRRAA